MPSAAIAVQSRRWRSSSSSVAPSRTRTARKNRRSTERPPRSSRVTHRSTRRARSRAPSSTSAHTAAGQWSRESGASEKSTCGGSSGISNSRAASAAECGSARRISASGRWVRPRQRAALTSSVQPTTRWSVTGSGTPAVRVSSPTNTYSASERAARPANRRARSPSHAGSRSLSAARISGYGERVQSRRSRPPIQAAHAAAPVWQPAPATSSALRTRSRRRQSQPRASLRNSLSSASAARRPGRSRASTSGGTSW